MYCDGVRVFHAVTMKSRTEPRDLPDQRAGNSRKYRAGCRFITYNRGRDSV